MPYLYKIVQRIIVSLYIILTPIVSCAQDTEANTNALPKPLEQSLTTLLEATSPKKTYPSEKTLQEILAFILSTQPNTPVLLEEREYGKGIFYAGTIDVQLQTIMEYLLNPNVPGEALYPTSIRRNAWRKNSPIVNDYKKFTMNNLSKSTGTIFSRGIEYEEITPDISSGCYYNYFLNRLFALYKHNNHTAFFNISFMPEPSTVGLRGANISDRDWEYVYTKTEGTNLTMLNWAKTYMYGSASITVYVQKPGSTATNVYIFKWTKAGWSGMNVVTEKHIVDGTIRFVTGLKQVIESPKCPSIEAIAKKYADLQKTPLPELQEQLEPYALMLAKKSLEKGAFSGNVFQSVLKDGNYPKTLSKENAEAELIKLYVKEEISQK